MTEIDSLTRRATGALLTRRVLEPGEQLRLREKDHANVTVTVTFYEIVVQNIWPGRNVWPFLQL